MSSLGVELDFRSPLLWVLRPGRAAEGGVRLGGFEISPCCPPGCQQLLPRPGLAEQKPCRRTGFSIFRSPPALARPGPQKFGSFLLLPAVSSPGAGLPSSCSCPVVDALDPGLPGFSLEFPHLRVGPHVFSIFYGRRLLNLLLSRCYSGTSGFGGPFIS